MFTFSDMYALDKLEQLKLSWMSCSGLKVCVSVSGTIDHKDIQDFVYPTSGETSWPTKLQVQGFHQEKLHVNQLVFDMNPYCKIVKDQSKRETK